MSNPELNSSLLRRYWFKTEEGFGLGVTAYSLDDAKALLRGANVLWDYQVLDIVEDVDIRDLDQNHVIPNMGPPNFRGVWYPNLSVLT
jgi:hypothetical protein